MQLLCANVMQPKLSEDSKCVEEWIDTKYTVLPIVWSRINITRELFLDGKMWTPEKQFLIMILKQ